MYQVIGNTVRIDRQDWDEAGLSDAHLWNDRRSGKVKIFGRGENSNIEFNIRTIGSQRLRKLGLEIKQDSVEKTYFNIAIDMNARQYYDKFRKPNGQPLESDTIFEYTNCASILNALKERKLEIEHNRKGYGLKRISKSDMWSKLLELYTAKAIDYRCRQFGNVRYFEKLFKRYLKDGYSALISGKIGNDNTRKVSRSMENLLLSLYRRTDKPFIEQVYNDYVAFTNGEKEIFDRETGEVFNPEDFCDYEGNPTEISVATVWNYLKDVVNFTSIYADRNGNFDYTNTLRPKNYRKTGQFSLSKISMDVGMQNTRHFAV